MKQNPFKHIASTEHMVDYDRYSHMQDNMIRSKSKSLCRVVEDIGITPEFVVTDYGCGPGHSAIDAVRPVVEAYRRLDPTGKIVVRHADQAANDWNALFAIVFGPDGYQRDADGIRSEAAVGSSIRSSPPLLRSPSARALPRATG